MSYETFTSMPVIIAAIAAWAIGVVGNSVWHWIIDWRQARMLGLPLTEYRMVRERHAGILASRKIRLERAARLLVNAEMQGGESILSGGSVPTSIARVPVAADRVQVEVTGLTTVFPGPEPGSNAGPMAVAEDNEPDKSPEIPRESRASSPEYAKGNVRLLVGADQQVTEFLIFECARHRSPEGRIEIRRDGAQWTAAYLRWAAIHSIGPVPECVFLKLLGKASGIQKDRVRVKDELGRVIRNAAGTPLREYVYALVDAGVKPEKQKRETKAEKTAREAAEVAERRKAAEFMPDQTWPEYLHSIGQAA